MAKEHRVQREQSREEHKAEESLPEKRDGYRKIRSENTESRAKKSQRISWRVRRTFHEEGNERISRGDGGKKNLSNVTR